MYESKRNKPWKSVENKKIIQLILAILKPYIYNVL